MKLKKKWLPVITLLVVLCVWCSLIAILPYTAYGAVDPFYRHGDDAFDVDLNFPLIKPYYAKAFPEGFPHQGKIYRYIWEIDLHGGENSQFKPWDSICCNIKIAIQNNLIFVYASDPQASETSSNQGIGWYILNPVTLEELGFSDQTEFNTYLKDNHLEEPEWQEPDDLHDEFNQTGCLDWFPDCKKIPPLFQFPPRLFKTD